MAVANIHVIKTVVRKASVRINFPPYDNGPIPRRVVVVVVDSEVDTVDMSLDALNYSLYVFP